MRGKVEMDFMYEKDKMDFGFAAFYLMLELLEKLRANGTITHEDLMSIFEGAGAGVKKPGWVNTARILDKMHAKFLAENSLRKMNREKAEKRRAGIEARKAKRKAAKKA